MPMPVTLLVAIFFCELLALGGYVGWLTTR